MLQRLPNKLDCRASNLELCGCTFANHYVWFVSWSPTSHHCQQFVSRN
jgi:hypothetical protein